MNSNLHISFWAFYIDDNVTVKNNSRVFLSKHYKLFFSLISCMAEIFNDTLNRESGNITFLVLILKRMIFVFQIQCHLSCGILVDLYEIKEISSFYYIYLMYLFFL